MQEIDFIPYQASAQLPGGNVLVLAPHPDDEVFGCAAAMLLHLRQGDALTVIIVTDGAQAQPHATETARAAYVQQRQAESAAAAAILGYPVPIAWDYPDRHLAEFPGLTQRLCAWLAAHDIHTVYAPSVHEIHPDHYALAQAAIHAVCALDRPITLMMYEIGAPLRPNVLVDQSADFARIQHAMRYFASQLAIQDYIFHVNALHGYRAYTLPAGCLGAEAFFQITNRQLQAQPQQQFGHTRLTQRLTLAEHRIGELERRRRRLWPW